MGLRKLFATNGIKNPWRTVAAGTSCLGLTTGQMICISLLLFRFWHATIDKSADTLQNVIASAKSMPGQKIHICDKNNIINICINSIFDSMFDPM